MAHFTAVYDACMLYPAPLRSLLMYLALTGLIRARWTDAIHEEWMRNVVRDYPDITREKAERVRDLMNAHVRDCLVTGYEDLIPALKQAARPATGRRCLRCRRRGRPGATSTAPRRLPCRRPASRTGRLLKRVQRPADLPVAEKQSRAPI